MAVAVNITFIKPTGSISSYESSNQANTSRLEKLSIPSAGEKLFYLSEDPNNVTSPLDGKHKWFDETVGYSGWVSKQYSNILGRFNEGTNPVIKINGNSIRYLILYSDIVDGPLLELVEVNNVVYSGIEGRVIIAFEEELSSVEIKVIKLSKPYQPVKITGIELGLSLDFDEETIVDYDFGVQSQSTKDGIEYRVISRFGSLELDNSNNLFNNLNELDLLQKDIPVKVTIDNKPFGDYLLQEGDLQVDSSSASFQLSDKMINLDQINWRKDYYLNTDITARNFIDFVMNYIEESYIFYDSRTEQVFNNTKLPVAIIDTSDVKTILVKICEITCSSIFMRNDGKICVKYLESTDEEVSE